MTTNALLDRLLTPRKKRREDPPASKEPAAEGTERETEAAPPKRPRKASASDAGAPPLKKTHPGNERVGSVIQDALRPENEARHRYRRDRVLHSVVMLLIASNLGLVALAAWLLPGYKVVPFIFERRDHSAQVVELQPLTVSSSTGQAMLESIVRDYVIERHSVVPLHAEMIRRWRRADGTVPRYSSKEVYEKFMSDGEKGKLRGDGFEILEQLRKQPFQRQIEIIHAERTSRDLWEVDFRTIDRVAQTIEIAASATATRRWKAHIRLTFASKSGARTREQILNNPLNVWVTGYAIQTVRNVEGDGS